MTLCAAARAASFLAVGGLLLVAGCFYQRVAGAVGERDGHTAEPA